MTLSPELNPSLPHQGTLHWATRPKKTTSRIVMVCNCGWRSQPRRPEAVGTLMLHLLDYRDHCAEVGWIASEMVLSHG